MRTFTVTFTATHSEDFEVEANSEAEAVAIIHEMYSEGELDYEDRPEYNITFTCGRVVETDWEQSLI